MKQISRYSFLLVAISIIAFSGCSTKQQKRQIDVLQAQMGVITDELVRLDQSLQDTRAAISAEENRLKQLEANVKSSKSRLGSLHQEESIIKGIYRTPSGFELPSIAIQKALKKAGYYQGPLDGKIGPRTRAAVEAFQADNGLTADGVVGRKTWAKLKVYHEAIK